MSSNEIPARPTVFVVRTATIGAKFVAEGRGHGPGHKSQPRSGKSTNSKFNTGF